MFPYVTAEFGTDVDPMVLHLFASFAETEAARISRRTILVRTNRYSTVDVWCIYPGSPSPVGAPLPRSSRLKTLQLGVFGAGEPGIGLARLVQIKQGET